MRPPLDSGYEASSTGSLKDARRRSQCHVSTEEIRCTIQKIFPISLAAKAVNYSMTRPQRARCNPKFGPCKLLGLRSGRIAVLGPLPDPPLHQLLRRPLSASFGILSSALIVLARLLVLLLDLSYFLLGQTFISLGGVVANLLSRQMPQHPFFDSQGAITTVP